MPFVFDGKRNEKNFLVRDNEPPRSENSYVDKMGNMPDPISTDAAKIEKNQERLWMEPAATFPPSAKDETRGRVITSAISEPRVRGGAGPSQKARRELG